MKKVLLATAAAVLFALPAAAQMACGPYIGMSQQLQVQYGEQVIEEKRVEVEQGVVVWLLWANPETFSWTLTAYLDGDLRMCAFSAGDDYHGITIDGLLGPQGVRL